MCCIEEVWTSNTLIPVCRVGVYAIGLDLDVYGVFRRIVLIESDIAGERIEPAVDKAYSKELNLKQDGGMGRVDFVGIGSNGGRSS